MPRKIDSELTASEPQHGKKPNQKIKPYVVMQYLLKYFDENHPMTAYDIIGFLNECGIDAERRSIYRDIDDINKVYLMMEENCSIDEAEEMLEEDETQKSSSMTRQKRAFMCSSGILNWTIFAFWRSAFIPQNSLSRGKPIDLWM